MVWNDEEQKSHENHIKVFKMKTENDPFFLIQIQPYIYINDGSPHCSIDNKEINLPLLCPILIIIYKSISSSLQIFTNLLNETKYIQNL